jgi:aspartyl-tRNA(Asn)/glutamyl-tRNA(Gln) amidotransferase subunit B
MISKEVKDKYKVTIGIECHVQLKSVSKLFSGANNDAREAAPNTLVNHIDFGLPGGLPVLNEEAVHLAAKAGFALNSSPQLFSKFDRKHYFYPDLPMGYQITQYDQPIVLGGSVQITVDGQPKTIGITRAHMEADAGKSVHPEGMDYSLVDLNRAGTPLLEIVSEPDMTSAAEAKAYTHELYLLMRYADVSDANLYYGNMRFDVNVSVSQTDELGTRTETKNINSFRSVEKVVDYEVNRQIEQLEKGQKIIQETRGWNDAKQKTFTQRVKENADDYRYMPDPDLPPVILSEDYVKNIKEQMPIMPEVWREKLSSIGLNSEQIETLLDAEVEDNQSSYLKLIKNSESNPELVKFIANWAVNLEIPLRREEKLTKELDDSTRLRIYSEVQGLFKDGKLSSTNVKALLEGLLSLDKQPNVIDEYAEQKGFIQMSDESAIEDIVKNVINENLKAVEDIKAGEQKAIGFLTGQIMKQSKGQANPALAQSIIKRLLDL